MEYKIDDLVYGAKYHDSFWSTKNIFVSISNCLANCTCMVYGDCLATDTPVPIARSCNANNFHNNLANGWSCIDFDLSKIAVGDIIEWTNGCHVARVSKIVDGVVYVNASWYTGIHGVAVYDGHWDTRPFNSLEEVSDFMSTHYPTRFYHCWDLDREIKGIGYQPRYILKQPNMIAADGEDKSVDQIYVSTNEQNVRDEPYGVIIGTASSGYFNVYGSAVDNYTWYQIRNDMWIAGVKGAVTFIEGEDDIKKLKRENAKLKEKLRQIHELSEV